MLKQHPSFYFVCFLGKLPIYFEIYLSAQKFCIYFGIMDTLSLIYAHELFCASTERERERERERE
jgi:hypothetical protein